MAKKNLNSANPSFVFLEDNGYAMNPKLDKVTKVKRVLYEVIKTLILEKLSSYKFNIFS